MLSWMFLFIMNDNRWYLQLKKMNWISIVYILLNLLLYLWKELVLVLMYQLSYTLANLHCKSCVPISILWWVTFIYLYTFYIYKSTMPKPHIGQTFKFHVHINISQKTISHKHEPYVVFLLTCMYFCLNTSYLYTFKWFTLVKITAASKEDDLIITDQRQWTLHYLRNGKLGVWCSCQFRWNISKSHIQMYDIDL